MPVDLSIIESTNDLGITVSQVIIESATEPGPAGPGVAEGGDTGQVLAKASDDDFDTEWIDANAGTVLTVTAGTNIAVDNTDPANPIVAAGTGLATDAELSAAVAAEATLARDADNLTSGTVADARIASTIARDSEVSAAVSASQAFAVQRVNHTGTQLAATISDLAEAVQDVVGAMAVDGVTVNFTYDDTAGTLTAEVQGLTSANVSNFTEAVDDRVAGLLVGGTNITLTYDDTAGTLTIDAAGGADFAELHAGLLAAKMWDGSAYVWPDGTQPDTAAWTNIVFIDPDGTNDPATSPGGRDVDGDLWEDSSVGAGDPAGGLIAVKSITADHNYQTTSPTVADVDASEMFVTFDAPASGTVVVKLEAYTQILGVGVFLYQWGLREGSTTVADLKPILALYDPPNVPPFAGRMTAEFTVSGLSAGSHTLKWAWACEASTSPDARILTGDSGGLPSSAAGNDARLTVWAAP